MTNNWALKLFAVLFAFLLWMVVVNIDNPFRNKPITKTVAIRNEQVLTDNDLTYTVNQSRTVELTIPVRTLSYNSVKAEDFNVWVDLSEWNSVLGNVPIHWEYRGDKRLFDSDSVRLSTQVLKISVEEMQTLNRNIEVELVGEPAEGYAIGSTEVIPSKVEIRAPGSIAKKIAKVVAVLDVTDASSDVSSEVKLTVYDGNNEEISLDNEKITISAEAALVKASVLTINSVPVVVGEVGGVPMEGYRYTTWSCSVERAKIAGSRAAAGAITSITLDSELLDVSGANEDVTVELDLNDYLPEGLRLVGMETSKVTVTLHIEPLTNRTFDITNDNVDFLHRRDNQEYRLADGQTLQLTVIGLKDDLDALTLSDLTVSINVEGMDPGLYTLPVTVMLDDAFSLQNEINAMVEITLADEESGGSTSSASGSTAAPESRPAAGTAASTAAKPTAGESMAGSATTAVQTDEAESTTE